MEVLDALNLGEFAQYFSKMAMFPVFDLAYYIVSILYLKYEPGKWDRFIFYLFSLLIHMHETECDTCAFNVLPHYPLMGALIMPLLPLLHVPE